MNKLFPKALKRSLMALLMMGAAASLADNHYKVSVDFSAPSVPFEPYWKSSGLSPSDLLLTKDMEISLKHMGATRGGTEFFRPHYILDLIEITGREGTQIRYDWARFDKALDNIVHNGIHLVFEWMGNPSAHFQGYKTEQQVALWETFVEDVTRHLLDRYGSEEIRQWMFETTNEADIHPFWEHGAADYLRYFDATNRGMRKVDASLNLGGPANGRFMSPLLKMTLEHVDQPGKTAPEFLSSHYKATPWSMVRLEEWKVDYIRKHHPNLKTIPFVNDEADPIGGWGVPYWWRAGAWHAAFFAQSIDAHNQVMIDKLGVDYKLLSNDHGFSGTWGQRTQYARFLRGDNSTPQKGSGDEGGWKPFGQSDKTDTRPETQQFFLIKKPVQSVMSLLDFLGPQRYPVEGFPEYRQLVDRYVSDNPNIGCMATRRLDQAVALLCYNKPEMSLNNGLQEQMEPSKKQRNVWKRQSGKVRLNLAGLNLENPILAELRLDNKDGNAYELWKKMGSPEDPSAKQLQKLVEAQEPSFRTDRKVAIDNGALQLDVDLPSASVSLIVLSSAPKTGPGDITALSRTVHLGIHGESTAVLDWKSTNESGLIHYEVHYARPGSSEFKQLSRATLLDRSWVHANAKRGGQYKVRAVDFWGNKGEFSSVVTL
jgi:L-iduronidase